MSKAITSIALFVIASHIIKFILIKCDYTSGYYHLVAKAFVSIPVMMYFLYQYRTRSINQTYTELSKDKTIYLILALTLIYFIIPLRHVEVFNVNLISIYTVAASTLALVTLEELVFRGYLYNYFKEHNSIRTSQILSSSFFAVAHVGNFMNYAEFFITANQIIVSFGYGMILSAAYARHNSIRLCIGIHFCVNYLQELILAHKTLQHNRSAFDMSFQLGTEIWFSVGLSAILVCVSFVVLSGRDIQLLSKYNTSKSKL